MAGGTEKPYVYVDDCANCGRSQADPRFGPAAARWLRTCPYCAGDPDSKARRMRGPTLLEWERIASYLHVLSDRERRIVELRTGYGEVRKEALSVAAVARIMGLSTSGVRAVEKRAYRKLRAARAAAGGPRAVSSTTVENVGLPGQPRQEFAARY